MKLTKYTKYCLENGDALNILVHERFITTAQKQALLDCGAEYAEKPQRWCIKMQKEDYKEKCAKLRGLTMAYFVVGKRADA